MKKILLTAVLFVTATAYATLYHCNPDGSKTAFTAQEEADWTTNINNGAAAAALDAVTPQAPTTRYWMDTVTGHRMGTMFVAGAWVSYQADNSPYNLAVDLAAQQAASKITVSIKNTIESAPAYTNALTQAATNTPAMVQGVIAAMSKPTTATQSNVTWAWTLMLQEWARNKIKK